MTVKRQVFAAWAVVSAVTALALIQALLPWPGVAKAPTVQDLQARVEALEAKLACVTASGTPNIDMNVFFDGCNVNIRNGFSPPAPPGCGLTCTTNSLGNLIIGYNENPGGFDRDGSHNLVIGPTHTYTSYGGLVAGSGNTISGGHASVTAGSLNVASAFAASVSGGRSNQALSFGASVSGGTFNIAGDPTDASVGQDASVSGGSANQASAFAASVSGGDNNEASGNFATVSGGGSNVAGATRATVSGGSSCSLAGLNDWGATSNGTDAIGDCP